MRSMRLLVTFTMFVDLYRHVGDLGNIEVDEDGKLEHHILTDNVVALVGPNSIIAKAIVVSRPFTQLNRLLQV